jgi:hypothetical protein
MRDPFFHRHIRSEQCAAVLGSLWTFQRAGMALHRRGRQYTGTPAGTFKRGGYCSKDPKSYRFHVRVMLARRADSSSRQTRSRIRTPFQPPNGLTETLLPSVACNGWRLTPPSVIESQEEGNGTFDSNEQDPAWQEYASVTLIA